MVRKRSLSSGSPRRARPPHASFRRGDVVEWNSEAGRVRGRILKKVVSNLRFKGYVHRASRSEPQYLIKSLKTDHIAMHKGRALRHAPAGQGKQLQR